LVAVAPAFSIVLPVFSTPFPTVRAVAFAPCLIVSPVSLAAFFTVFPVFSTGPWSCAQIRPKGKTTAARMINVNFLINSCLFVLRDRFPNIDWTQFAIRYLSSRSVTAEKVWFAPIGWRAIFG
jgi:hypothetical protein